MVSQKQKAFVLRTFETKEPTQSYLDVYKCKDKSVASSCATKLLKKAEIQAYLKELNTPGEVKAIASVMERKERLTEIAMEDIETKYGVNRQPSISAITELNKMDKLYAPEIDQKIIQITVSSEEGKQDVERLLNGERT